MSNENQLGSNQSEQTVRVCCTRSRLQGEGSHPHFNPISETNILDESSDQSQCKLICRICGMPLILGNSKRYVPIEKLGSGGFGVTFTAVDLKLDDGPVLNRPKRVIKQLCPIQQLPPVVLQKVQRKFRGEAQVLAKLHHPNIPILFDYFEEEATDKRLSSMDDGDNSENEAEQSRQRFFYLVQQYVDGIDLDKALRQHGAFSEQEVKTFLRSLLKILNDIHSGNHHSSGASIIHRDIKPANIICSTKEVVREDGTKGRVANLSEGKFYLVDFGTVKEVVQAVEQQVPSQASAIVSYGFSPPEQIAHKPVGFFSDIYALGATCISLLTARNPDDLSVPYDLNVWKEHTSVSPKFAAILDKMLAQRFGDRYQTAEEVLQDLNNELVPPPPPPPPPPPTKRPKLPIIAASVVGLLVLAAVGVGSGKVQNLLRNNVSPIDLPTPDPISAGGKPIAGSAFSLSGEYEKLKGEGMQAFADGDYVTARNRFAEIRDKAKEEWERRGANLDTAYGRALQDPTVLAFKNNAEVRLRHQNGEPIYTIAAAVPLNINIGQQMLFGIAQAQDQAVNPQNGEQSVNIEIVIANDLNKPNQAEAVAKSLTEDTFDERKILAVIGHYTSDSTCVALKNHYAPAEIPVISPLSTAANLRQTCNGGSWFFRTTSSTKIEAATLAEYLIRQKPGSRVAVFYTQTDLFSLNLYNDFVSALSTNGGLVVEQFDLTEPINVGEILNQIEVDALAVLPDGRAGTTEPFDRAIEVIKADRGEKLVVGSNPLYDKKVIDRVGEAASLKDKLILATDWYRECEPRGEGGFVWQAEQEYWFGGVNRTTALSYEAVQAVQATLTEGVTRDQIRQKLTEIQIPSDVFANKTISFDPSGNRKELDKRILTTLGSDPGKPFDLVQGCLAN